MAVNTFHYGAAPLFIPPPITDLQQLRGSCIESHPLVGTYKLDERAWANEPAKTSLQLLNHRIMRAFKAQPKTSCTSGIIAGTVASLLTKNPLLLLAGLSECFPWAQAQQKVGSEFQVNTYTLGSQLIPSVASFDNGNFVVAWQSSGYGVFGQLFNETGAKIGSEFQVNTYTSGGGQGSPSVASLRNSNFVVVWDSWYQDGGAITGVYGQLLDKNGAKIGSEFQVNTYTNDNQANPSVASLMNGNFVTTWHSNGQDGSSYGIFAQLFNGVGAKVGNEFRVNTYTTSAQRFPSITSFPNNNTFVVVWQSLDQDGSNDGVYGQLFEGNGSKLGNEFQVNTYSNNSQSNPSVTTLRKGNFIVTWDSDGQDGNFTGIYGQIFHDNVTYPSSSTTTSTSTTSTTSTTTSSTTTSSSTSTTSSSSTSTSTSTISSIRSSTVKTISSSSSDISSEINLPSSVPNNRLLWLWLLLGIGGGTTCLGITGYLLLKNKDELFVESAEMGQTDHSRPSSEYGFVDISQRHSDYANRPSRADSENAYANRPQREGVDPEERETVTPSRVKSSLPPKREEKTHTRIGDKYDLMNKISREEAQTLYEQTGIQVQFPEGKYKTKVLLGVGNFGKLRIAHNLETGQFACVKKIKGDRQIAQSRQEAALQSKLSSKSNIMPIWDFVEAESSQREPVLYQFMPLAGFGDGEELRNQLEGITTAKEREQILAHVAKCLLTGVFNMHQAAIYHLDIKPANMVFDMEGELYVIDFGCAKELSDGWIQEKISGDTKYFSPERMEFHRQVHNGGQPVPVAANRVDSWAVGLSLLELAIGDYPFDRTSVIERFEKWDTAYFQRKLDEIPLIKNPAPGSLMAIVKGLLDVDPQKRLNITDALAQESAKKPFSSSSEQEVAFAHLKQLDPSSTQLTEPSPPREKNANYEHVFFQKFGDQSDYTHPMPTRSVDSTSYTDPIPRPSDTSSNSNSTPLPGDAAEYTSPIPPPGNNF